MTKVLSDYPKLLEYLEENPSKRELAEKYLTEISANYSLATVKKLERLFDATFAKLYEKINLETAEGVDIPQLQKDSHLILCPNHQSYADFLGISYAVYKKYSLPVFIAAGMNLNVFPVGNLFRKGGAFFIRRSFKGEDLYKLVLEAYIYHLLKNQKIIKFYFEGGRSRTGRLLPPRYGLFHMLLEAYSHLPKDKPLCFLPISISHETLPEARAHSRESLGGKKIKESTWQLVNLLSVMSKRFGSIHLKAGQPIFIKHVEEDRRAQVQDLAFACFRSVGKEMMISPTSLLSLVLLDNVSGALTKKYIYSRCESILAYARDFQIPLSPNLDGNGSQAIEDALDLLIDSKKVEKIKSKTLDRTFYHVNPQARSELLYLKNTILHHFLIPHFIASAWINIFRGSIDSLASLKHYFLEQRRMLKHEFYLPKSGEMFEQIRFLIASIMQQPDFQFEQTFQVAKKDFYKLGQVVGPYSASFAHIYEAYYVAAQSLKSFIGTSFDFEAFQNVSKEVFQVEKDLGKVVRYPEAYSVSIMRSALSYFAGEKIIEIVDENEFHMHHADKQMIDRMIEKFSTQLSDITTLNLKKFHD